MRKTSYAELCEADFHLTLLSINRTKEKPEVSFSCTKNLRRWDRFFYVSAGAITFEYDKDKTLTAKAGSVVYIPYDTVYRSEWGSPDEIGYITAEFLLRDSSGGRISLADSIEIATIDKSGAYLDALSNLYKVWIKGELGYKIKAYSMFLEILRLIALGSIKSELKTSHSTIYKAILYLENNYISEVSVDELAKMCGMCESYFRRQFHDYAGMPPIKYKNYLRAKKASELLSTGEYTVGEAADMVGIPDTAYFNRVFKGIYGKSPKEAKLKEKS